MARDNRHMTGACGIAEAHSDKDHAQDILDVVVTSIADDDYNHIPEDVLRARLEDIRQTATETMLWDMADQLIERVRYYLTEPGDPEYGEADA